MHVRIQQWGNSLALRIPKVFAEEIHVKQGTSVDLSVESGKIVLAPLAKRKYELKNLLAGVAAHNIHSEVDVGQFRGQEIW